MTERVKPVKKRSLKIITLRLWIIATGICLVLFVLFGMALTRNAREEYMRSERIITDHYAEKLNRDISIMVETVDEIYVNSIFFRRLIWYNLDDFDWVDNTWHLHNSLKENCASLDFPGILFYYDVQKDALRSASSPGYTDEGLNDHFRDYMRDQPNLIQKSGYYHYNDDVWILSYKGIRGRILGYMINLDDYLDPKEMEEVYYLNENNEIISHTGSTSVPEQLLADAAEENGQIVKSNLILTGAKVQPSDIRLITVMDTGSILSLFKRPQILLPVVLQPLLIFLIFVSLYRFHHKAILIPVQHLLKKIHELQGPESPALIEDSAFEHRISKIAEYQEINDRLDELLHEIDDLTEARNREELNAKSALLQYYQLQMDPHFYLNCLNSISSLLQNKTPEIANDMIMALSFHFRYVFQSNRTMVSLSEEITELQNYCNIFSIKGGVPILFTSDVPESIRSRRIPILALQTFVENSVKHVAKKGKILTVKVSAQEDSESGELYLRIVDNGPGYPEPLLLQMNQPIVEYSFDSRHVGIQNLKYRCHLLYNGAERFRFYNAPQGGAVTEIMLPAREKSDWSLS